MKKIFPLLAFLWLSAITLTTAQWSQITNIPVAPVPFPINGIAYAEIDGANLYIGTWDGIYKSTDNGTTWNKINTDIYYAYIQASGNTVCAFSYGDYQYYYSTDGGATFQQGGPGFIYVTSMLVQGNKVFVTDDTGFYVSDDQGETFTNTNLYPSGFHNAAIIQTPAGKILLETSYDPGTFELLGTHVYRSTDDVNWTEVGGSSGSNPLPAMQNGHVVHWASAGYVNGAILAGGYNEEGQGGLYKTTDLGANWFPVNNSLFAYNGSIVTFGSNRVYVVGDNPYVQQTSTDGANWSPSNAPGTVYAGEGTKFFAFNGPMYLSTNNGASWPQIGLVYGRDQVRDYLAIRANTRFVVTNHNGIFKGVGTNPANMTWTKVLGAGVNGGGNYGWDIFKKGTVLLAGIDYVAGGQQGIFRSTNEGSTWTKTHNGAGLCFFDDGSIVWAGVDYEGIFKSYNSGQTWTAANNGIPSDPNIRSPSAFVKAGSNLIASFYFGGIYLSSNQGASWSQVSTQNSIYCLAKAGGALFAGAQNGLMKSTDNGLTWNYVQNDLYNATTVTALYVKADDEIYIGTGSMGMFVTSDGGETLESRNDGAGDNTYVSCIAREGNKLFAGWNNIGFGNYYYNPAYYGRMLWQYNDNNNFRPSPATDRDGAGISEPRLAIFPNPVQDVLQFSLNTEPEQVANLQIINTKGETVRKEQGPISSPALQVQDLSNGVYFLKVTLQDGTNLTQRFMVMQGR